LSPEPAARRPRCVRCGRPPSHCVCEHVHEVANRTRILILQHPDEQKHPLNTGRLAVLGLRNAELLVGEHFPQLPGLIAEAESAFLLFPTSDPALSQPLAALPQDEAALLIVPDGTWRKARQIVRANPVLGALPHVSLPLGDPSEYRVRRAREPAAVATIEAIVRALTVLEPGRDFQPVLAPFRVMVEWQIQAFNQARHKNAEGARSPVRD